MKKIYLLLVNGLLITSAVGVTALTVAGCNDEDKDKDKGKKVADEDVKKALEKFQENPLEIAYLEGHDAASTSLKVVSDEIRKKLAKNSTVLTEEIVKKIEFDNSLLIPDEDVPVEATYTGDTKINARILVRESYGTEFVKDKLAAYTDKNPLQAEYTGDGDAKAASSPEVTGKIKKALRHARLTSGLLNKISFGATKITPGTPVEITPKYPGSQGAKIWLRANNNDGSKALVKYSTKEAPLTLEHLAVEKETKPANELQDDIRKALKEQGGKEFAGITITSITFDATKLAPGVIVEVEATYNQENTYIYIRENYDLANISAELEKHKKDATAVQIDYVGAGELPISDKGVLKNLGEAIGKLSTITPSLTSAAIKQMSFSGSSPLTPGGTAVTVTVTYPGNTLKDGGYPKKTTDIKVKEKEKPQ